MKKETQIDRSAQGRNEVVMTDMPKSGFNLTYNNYFGGLVLGRLIPIAYQWLMPNDKFSGSNQHQLTFNQLQTPVLSDVTVSMHNFYCTLRSVDKDLPALLTPTKLNNMSANGSTPRFSVAQVMRDIMKTYFNGVWSQPLTYFIFETTGDQLMNKLVKPKTADNAHLFRRSIASGSANITTVLDKSYCGDVIADLYAKLSLILDAWRGAVDADTAREHCRLYFRAIVDFFLGQGSMADFLGYPIINHDITDVYANAVYAAMSATNGDHRLDQFIDIPFTLDAPMVNEYPLRILYSIWLEYYRNFDVEPLTNDTPDYHTWGATALPLDTLVQLLVMRPRCWSADMFISAGVDDISRHVFAPILNAGDYYVQSMTPTMSGGSMGSSTPPASDSWSSLETSYLDTNGVKREVVVPMPAGIMSAFASDNDSDSVFGVELNAIRKAHMIENYLKRMYYGGDEYRDRCLSIYGSRIEDYRINRPELLSSSLDNVAVRQEVANTGAVPGSDSTSVQQGDRLATATASTEGSDGFTSFSPEFGMYIGLMSVMPKAQYDPLCLQLTMAKTFDFPAPQFANSMEETIMSSEMSRSTKASDIVRPFGFAPYAHAWRARVDSVHGEYLDEKSDYSFARVWASDSLDNMPKLNHYFLHCHPRLTMFVDQTLLDGQMYGVGKHNFLVERVLPTPVETI